MEQHTPKQMIQPSPSEEEKHRRLRALLADHRGFLNDRLSSFVGRQAELATIRQHIAELLPTGGYITITGQAGQGKSSVIAHLVESYGIDTLAFHFIPFNAGPDHQVGLLRNIMAHLILKYDLSDFYVASESRSALCEYFPKVLAELTAKGGQEVIFIDGLDQLKEDIDGGYDLSFLPNDLPQGIVFVLGTRPDDTLHPLTLLKPRYEYRLPNLSRADFDLILAHRGVHLDKVLTDQFYQVTQENALYLDLVAKELAEDETITPHTVLEYLPENPENLFSLVIKRFKRKPEQWSKIIKPLLGVLLAAHEPLAFLHLRQIIEADADELHDGIKQLRGLLAQDEQQRYFLYHLKLQDYLRQGEASTTKEDAFDADEERAWHKKLAHWCSEGNVLTTVWHQSGQSIAEQKRREYGLRHCITHLYLAQEWDALFEMLDSEDYGRTKRGYDPGMRSYAQDLDLGRQAAGWNGWSQDEGIKLLPHLWKYSLLRCSLTSRADTYTPEVFEVLLLLNHNREALSLAELLTKPDYKAQIFILIGKWLEKHEKHRWEGLQLFIRAQEIATSFEEREKLAKSLAEICQELTQACEWERTQAIANLIQPPKSRAEALCDLADALIQAQQWESIETTIHLIDDERLKETILYQMGQAFVQLQQWERAEAIAQSLKEKRIDLLQELGITLAHAQQRRQAQAIALSVKDELSGIYILLELGKTAPQGAATIWNQALSQSRKIKAKTKRIETLSKIGETLTQAQQWEMAEVVWDEVCSLISTREMIYEHRQELFKALIRTQQWERIEVVLQHFQRVQDKASTLREFVEALIYEKEWERIEAIARSLEDREDIFAVQQALGPSLAQAQQDYEKIVSWHAKDKFAALQEFRVTLAHFSEDTRGKPAVLRALGIVLAQAQQWDRAEAIAHSLENTWDKAEVLRMLGVALAQAQQWDRAEAIAHSLENTRDKAEVPRALARSLENIKYKAEVLRVLCTALVQAQQWDRAEAIARSLEDAKGRSVRIQVIGQVLDSVFTQTKLRDHVKAIAYFLEGRWDAVQQVLDVAIPLFLNSARDKSAMLLVLSAALAQAQQWDQAEAIAHSLEDTEDKYIALLPLGVALAQARQWDRAEAIVQSFENRQGKFIVQVALGISFAQAQQWDRAEAIAHSLEHQWAKFVVLRVLVITLTQAQQWERAEAIAHSLEHKQDKIEALRTLSIALTQAQQWERAEATRDSIMYSSQVFIMNKYEVKPLFNILVRTRQWKHAETIARSLREEQDKSIMQRVLGIALAQTQQWDQAVAIAQSLENPEDKTKVWRALAVALAQAQQWEHAEVITRSLENTKDKSSMLRALGVAFAQAQQWEQAIHVIDSLEDRWDKAEVWRTFGVTLAQAQQWERAIAIIHSLEEKWDKSVMLLALGATFAQAQQQERAEATARSLEDGWDKSAGLRGLGISLAQAQYWKSAEAIAHSLENARDKSAVLQALSVALAQAQLWERAEATARSLEGARDTSAMLRELGVALAQAQLWERAEAIAHSLEDEWDKAEVQLALGVALAQAQQWEHAEAIAHSLEERWGGAEGLRTLDMALAQAQLRKHTQATAHAPDDTRDTVPQPLGIALARTQQWDQIKTLLSASKENEERTLTLKAFLTQKARVHQLSEADISWIEELLTESTHGNHTEKAKLLGEVIRTLSESKEYEYILHLVQHAWIQANTRGQIVELLPLATKLAVLQPEIGVGFYDAFMWANKLLA